MKNITKIIALAFVILGFSASSFAQLSATSTSSASATILTPITITNTTPLNFGTIGPLSTTSTVILATDNSRTGTATLFTFGAATQSGIFAITGTPNAAFSVVFPTTIIDITGPGTKMTINIGDFVSDITLVSTLDNLGAKELKVGATLQVGASQAVGNYAGSYPVTVNYN